MAMPRKPTPPAPQVRLRPADSREVRELTNRLRDLLLSACDGRNATWRVEQTMRAIATTEKHIRDHPKEFRFEQEGSTPSWSNATQVTLVSLR
jgi:hypothetical protein